MGACVEGAHHQLVFELCRPGSLQGVLTSGVRLPFARKVKIAEGVCAALAWLHAQSPPLVHGQLRPASVLLSGDRVKLADVGATLTDLTSAQLLEHGIANWFAPERFGRLALPSPKADCYAFGLLLHWLLSERTPYEQVRSWEALGAAVAQGPPPPPPGPDRYKQVMAACLASDPAARPELSSLLSNGGWDEVLLDATLRGEKAAMAMWRALRPGPGGEVPAQVPWKDFLHGLLSFLELRASGAQVRSDLRYRCLKAVLDVPQGGGGTCSWPSLSGCWPGSGPLPPVLRGVRLCWRAS